MNITHPFKPTVMSLLDALDDGAVAVGAVNTVAMREGELVGYNTDMPGFRDSFVRGLPGASLDARAATGCGRGRGAAVAMRASSRWERTTGNRRRPSGSG